MLQRHIEADLFAQRTKRMFLHTPHSRNNLQDKTSELRYNHTIMHQKQTFNMCYNSKHTTKVNLLHGLPKNFIIFRTLFNANRIRVHLVHDKIFFPMLSSIFSTLPKTYSTTPETFPTMPKTDYMQTKSTRHADPTTISLR